MKHNSVGILLHISSLPSVYGIGDFGPNARKFVDALKLSAQNYWQILPLTVTNPITGNSPYSSYSAFAMNPIFISPDLLMECGLLHKSDLPKLKSEESSRVDYDRVGALKKDLLRKAYHHYQKTRLLAEEFDGFCREHEAWLDDYALFEVIRHHLDFQVWSNWPRPLQCRDPQALNDMRKTHQDEFTYFCFVQFLLYKQWFALKSYANKNEIDIIGDLPIYVEYDSVDVWVEPEYFKLDRQMRPRVVAGVPPDYFSETGQRWGNPLYNWRVMRQRGYDWWLKRLKHNLHIYDTIRIDHFRGMVQYWEISVEEKTAINGTWRYVPTRSFFPEILKHIDIGRLIAEDLGIITDDVRAAMQKYGFPGMKVLMFAFGGNLDDHPYLPHNYSENCLVYTGTHDNNTVQGWYQHDASQHEKLNLSRYINEAIDATQVHWTLIEMAYRSKAELSLIPLQDVLGYGAEARMNIPGTVGENWAWRMSFSAFHEDIQRLLAAKVHEWRGKASFA